MCLIRAREGAGRGRWQMTACAGNPAARLEPVMVENVERGYRWRYEIDQSRRDAVIRQIANVLERAAQGRDKTTGEMITIQVWIRPWREGGVTDGTT